MKINCPKKNQTQAGFTLVELLVAMAILAVILVGLLMMLTSFLKVRNSDETDQLIKSEGNYILDRLEFLVRNGVTMPDICCQSLDKPECRTSSGNHRMAVLLNNRDADGNAQEDDATGKFLSYVKNEVTQDGGRIKLKVSTAAPTSMHSDLVTIVSDSLYFNCEVTDSAPSGSTYANHRAVVTFGFKAVATKDTLGANDMEMGQVFTRTTAVANNFPYIK